MSKDFRHRSQVCGGSIDYRLWKRETSFCSELCEIYSRGTCPLLDKLKTCKECGVLFVASKVAVYCSVKCSNRWKQRERRKNPINRLDSNLGSAISGALRSRIDGQTVSRKAGRKWECLVGYTLDDLVQRLESQFHGAMSWDNYGEWHIDHIIPVSMFLFSSAEDESFRKCWSLDNLQPLWALDNIIKSDQVGSVRARNIHHSEKIS